MSQLNNIPKQSYFNEALQSPIDSTQTTGIILSDVPNYVPGGEDVRFNILDPDNPETITATGWNAATNELSGVTRGVDTYTGEGATGSSHGAGITVVLSDDWNVFADIQTAVNSKADLDSPSFTTDIQVPVYADAAARDAGIPAPANGMMVYNTADGLFQVYQAGAWGDLDTGAAQPNATTAVAGKVELATDVELDAGTDIGGTGASNVAVPSQIARVIQDSQFTFQTTGGIADAYTLTLTPAPTALATGQVFFAKVSAANTGASTINVNGLGVTTIKKFNDQDLESGDLEVDQIIAIAYDGTNFQLVSPLASQLTTAEANTLTGGENSDADSLHTHLSLGTGAYTGSRIRYQVNFESMSPSVSSCTVAAGATDGFVNVQSSGASWQTFLLVPGNGAFNRGQFDDNKDYTFDLSARAVNGTAGDRRFGFGATGSFNNTYDSNTDDFVGFAADGATLYAVTADGGTGATTTDVSAGITFTNWNTFRVEFTNGTDAKFYINKTLVATHNTNLPNGNNDAAFGIGGTTNGEDFYFTNPLLDIEL